MGGASHRGQGQERRCHQCHHRRAPSHCQVLIVSTMNPSEPPAFTIHSPAACLRKGCEMIPLGPSFFIYKMRGLSHKKPKFLSCFRIFPIHLTSCLERREVERHLLCSPNTVDIVTQLLVILITSSKASIEQRAKESTFFFPFQD